LPISNKLGELGTMLALAATAYHALRPTPDAALPDLIVGHGVLGRLLARLTIALGGAAPTVWETQAGRRDGALGYRVVDPAEDTHSDYTTILDASGDSSILDVLMPKLRRGGEIILAGFYSAPLKFDFPPAFMREARIRVAAEWKPEDFTAVRSLAESGSLSLEGLITHRLPATEADAGYRTAFENPDCLKMILDWKGVHTC
jgi:3-hydroxyethyl bacteriochlorophyllide a dehydrogenase